jgi:hypothetical protein
MIVEALASDKLRRAFVNDICKPAAVSSIFLSNIADFEDWNDWTSPAVCFSKDVVVRGYSLYKYEYYTTLSLRKYDCHGIWKIYIFQ